MCVKMCMLAYVDAHILAHSYPAAGELMLQIFRASIQEASSTIIIQSGELLIIMTWVRKMHLF